MAFRMLRCAHSTIDREIVAVTALTGQAAMVSTLKAFAVALVPRSEQEE